MTYYDYIHCMECDCKLIYDGDDSIRDRLYETYGISEENRSKSLICPICLNKTKNELYLLKQIVNSYAKLFFDPTIEINTIKHEFNSTPRLTELFTEVWVDNKCVKIYRGQDAIDCELGKIPLPEGAKLKIIDY